MMKLIRHKDAAGSLPEKENRKGSLRGILGLALLVMLGAVLAAGGTGTRTYAWGTLEAPGIEENGELVTFPSTRQEETEKTPEINTNWNGAAGSEEEAYAFVTDRMGDAPMPIANGDGGTDLNEAGWIVESKLTDGDGNPVDVDDEIVLGEKYSYYVKFQEGNPEQFKNPMTFKLPDGFKTRVVSGQAVKKDGKEIGTYSIDENGVVTFDIPDEYLNDYTNVWIDMTFDMTAVGTEDGTGVKFPWEGEGERTFGLMGKPEVKLAKEAGEYNPADHTIAYTVTLDVTEGVVADTVITDTMEKGVSLLEGAENYTITVTDEYGNVITLDPAPTLEKTEDGWITRNLPSPLVKGQKVTIEYEAAVEFDEKGANVQFDTSKGETRFHFTVDNTAKVDCNSVPGEDESVTGTKEAPASKTVDDKQLEKDGTLAAGNGIDWEIHVGSGSFDVRGATLTDAIGGEGNQWVDTEKPLEFKWKDSNDHTMKTKEVTWVFNGNGTINRKAMEDQGITNIQINGETEDGKERIVGFDVTIPDNTKDFWNGIDSPKDSTRTWTEGDWVKVEYYTKYTPPADGTQIPYTNHVSGFAEALPEGVDGKIIIGSGGIKKDFKTDVYNETEDYIEYTFTVKVPPMDQLYHMHSDDGADERSKGIYPYFYIEDQLEFPSVRFYDDNGNKETKEYRYFVDNIPENIKLTAIGVDGEITFTELDEPVYGDEDQGYTYVLRHKSSVDKSTRAFEIWFNTNYQKTENVKNDYHDSVWPINEEVTLTFTYQIPGNSKIVKEVQAEDKKKGIVGIYEDTSLTLRDLLETGNRLDNEVWGKFHNVTEDEFKSEAQYTKTPGTVSINKRAQLLEDNEIQYNVSFDNAYKDAAGKDHDYLYLFTPTEVESFKFVDEFDNRLEYVPGSMEVLVLDAGGSLRGIYKVPDDAEVTFTDHKDKVTTEMVIPASEFKNRTVNNYLYECSTLYDWLLSYQNKEKEATAKDSRYIFRYKLRIKDENLKVEELTLPNTAHIKYGETDLKDDAVVKTTPDVLKKTAVQEVKKKDDGTVEKTEYVNYTIVVNPGAVNLAVGESEDGDSRELDRYTITDMMSDGMTADWNTVNIEYEYVDTDGILQKGSLTRVNSEAEVSREALTYAIQPVDGNGMALVVPDELKLTITYKVSLEKSADNTADASNTVSLSGETGITDTHNAKFNIDTNSANTGATDSIRLIKSDAKTKQVLDGSEFYLYTEIESETSDQITLKPSADAGKEDVTMYKSDKTYTPSSETDESGRPGILIEKPKDAEEDDYYVLVEKTAPAGYIPDSTPIVFKFGEKPGSGDEEVTVTIDGKDYAVTVKYYQNGDNLVVDNTPDVYELPETGGNGPVWLYLLGSMFIMAGVLALLYDRRLVRGRSDR